MIRNQQKFVLHTMVACTMSLLRMKYSFTCGFFWTSLFENFKI